MPRPQAMPPTMAKDSAVPPIPINQKNPMITRPMIAAGQLSVRKLTALDTGASPGMSQLSNSLRILSSREGSGLSTIAMVSRVNSVTSTTMASSHRAANHLFTPRPSRVTRRYSGSARFDIAITLLPD